MESFSSSEEILVVAARMLARRTLDHMRHLSEGTEGDRDAKTLRMLKGYYRSQIDERSKARVFTLEFSGISAVADSEFERILDTFADLIVETRDPKRQGRGGASALVRRGLVGGILAIHSGLDRRRLPRADRRCGRCGSEYMPHRGLMAFSHGQVT